MACVYYNPDSDKCCATEKQTWIDEGITDAEKSIGGLCRVYGESDLCGDSCEE
jgi:hypothetical protein